MSVSEITERCLEGVCETQVGTGQFGQLMSGLVKSSQDKLNQDETGQVKKYFGTTFFLT